MIMGFGRGGGNLMEIFRDLFILRIEKAKFMVWCL